MSGRQLISAVVVLCGLCRPLWGAPPAADDKDGTAAVVFFESQVRPLLVARCHKCHGAAPVKGGLSLVSRAGAIAGGDSGPVVVPGKPDESRLITAVRYADNQLQMPPDAKLSDAEIARLTRWIQEGVAWSAGGATSRTGRNAQ